MANDTVLPGTGETVRDVQKGTPKTQVFILDRGGSGTEDIAALGDATNGIDVDVTRLPALVAGTANIGDVDVLTVPAPLSTTGGGTEATAHRVTIANDSTGVLSVDDNGGSLTVDGTVTAVDAGSTAHDAAGAAVNPVAVGGYASAAAPADVSADADVVRAWHLRNGAAAGVLTAAGALIGGDATNGLDVDVTRLPALVAGTANIGDIDVLTVPAPLSTTGNGTAATALRVTVASDSTGVTAVTQSGTWTVQPGNTANTTAWVVGGDAAHDAADSGNPQKVGGKAANAVPTAVTANDRVNLWQDLNGRIITVQITDTATLSNVSASASSVTVLASNTGRKGAIVVNDSAVNCYLKYGSTASATSYTVKMVPDQMYEVPFGYTGILTGIWDSATGSARVTEIT